jgi:hypothetical protein
MINKRSRLVEDFSQVVFTIFDYSFASFGQNKSGNSPGIANKKGTLLWDNLSTLNFCLWSDYHVSSPILLLKLSLSLFLAKIITRLVVVLSKGSTPFRDLHTIYNKEV